MSELVETLDRLDECQAQLEEQQKEITDSRQMIADLRRELAELKTMITVTPVVLPKLDAMQNVNANRASNGNGKTNIELEKMIWKLNNTILELEGAEDRNNQMRISVRNLSNRLNDTSFKLMEANIRIRNLEEAAQRQIPDPPNPDTDGDMGPLGVRVTPHGPCPTGVFAGALAVPYSLVDEDDSDEITKTYYCDIGVGD